MTGDQPRHGGDAPTSAADLELYALDDDLSLEQMPEGNALGCWFSASSASTASCPGSSAASLGSASTFG